VRVQHPQHARNGALIVQLFGRRTLGFVLFHYGDDVGEVFEGPIEARIGRGRVADRRRRDCRNLRSVKTAEDRKNQNNQGKDKESAPLLGHPETILRQSIPYLFS
jgi:hypothetical protein